MDNKELDIELEPWFIDHLAAFEDFIPVAKQDSAAYNKAYTVGYGFTYWPDGTKVKEGDTISKEEAKELLPVYIKKQFKTIRNIFPDWDNYALQTKYGIIDHAYRGGLANFEDKSPKFTASLKEALKDYVITPSEIQTISTEMGINNNQHNLADRKYRRAALLMNLYDPKDLDSINTLGGSKNTIKSTRYTDFPTLVNTPGTEWNYIYLNTQAKAPFVNRLKTGKEDLEIGYDNGQPYIYSHTQTVTEPNILLRGWKYITGQPTKELMDMSNDYNIKEMEENAIATGDTIHVQNPKSYIKYFSKLH